MTTVYTVRVPHSDGAYETTDTEYVSEVAGYDDVWITAETY